jgi:hypothetical protein
MPVPPSKLKALINQQKKPPLPKSQDDDAEDAAAEDKGKPGNPGGGEPDEEADKELVEKVGQQVEDGKTNGKLVRLMGVYEQASEDDEEGPEASGEAPAWAEDGDTWTRAKTAVDPDGEGESKWEEPWLVVAHVYERMGGTITADAEGQEGGGEEDEEE